MGDCQSGERRALVVSGKPLFAEQRHDIFEMGEEKRRNNGAERENKEPEVGGPKGEESKESMQGMVRGVLQIRNTCKVIVREVVCWSSCIVCERCKKMREIIGAEFFDEKLNFSYM